MSHATDMAELVDQLRAGGVHVTKRRSGHYRIQAAGLAPVFCSATPSDWRSVRNTIATLRRAGYTWPADRAEATR